MGSKGEPVKCGGGNIAMFSTVRHPTVNISGKR